jgi:hypothetical protein
MSENYHQKRSGVSGKYSHVRPEYRHSGHETLQRPENETSYNSLDL